MRFAGRTWSFTWVILSIAALAFVCGARMVHAQDLSPGDRVELDWAGSAVEAEFVERMSNGWIRVRFDFNGIELTPVLPPDKIRPLAKRKGAAGKGSPGKGTQGEQGGKRPVRTWTDATGKFKTKARLIALDGDEVTLETEAGKTITMNLAKLSDADQAMARKIAARMERDAAAGADDANPFAGGDPGPPSVKPARQAAIEAGDWSECRSVVPAAPEGWSVSVGAAPAAEKLASKPIALPSSGKNEQNRFFEKVDGLLLARGAARGCVVIHDAHPGRAAETSIVPVDLAAGKAGAAMGWPSTLRPVDIDPEGKAVLGRADQMFAQGNAAPALGVWRISAGTFEEVRVWSPHPTGEAHGTAPSFAAFVDEDHVVCVTFPGSLVLWKVSAGKAVYRMEIAHGSTPAVSPDGKVLAAAVQGGVYLFDALSGDTLARLPGSDIPGGTLSFRPDGGQVASLSPQRLLVWNLAAGDVYRDIFFPAAIGVDAVDWLFGGYILAGGTTLVDLERRIVLWRYQHDGAAPFSRGYAERGGRMWCALGDGTGGRAIYPSRLPHDEAMKTAAGLDPARLLAVVPGSTFSVETRIQAAPDELARVRAALEGALASAGMKVGAGGLVLEAITETGESREMSYRSFGLDRTAQTVRVTDQISRLRIVENGKTIWEAMAVGGAPAVLQIKEGETIEQALAPYRKPNLTFFEGVTVPREVARGADAGAYGFSRITPQGIQPAPTPPIR